MTVDTKQRILDQTRLLANTTDASTLTTNHIAEHLNMSPGNLYYHFKNKEEIYRAIFVQMYKKERSICSKFKQAINKEKALLLFRELLLHTWDNRFIYLEITNLGYKDPKLKELYQNLVLATMEDIKDSIQLQIQMGNSLKKDFIEDYTQITGQILFGWPNYLETQSLINRADAELDQRAIDIVLQMLSHTSSLLIDETLPSGS